VDPAVRITHALAALQRQSEEGRVNVHSAQSMPISRANPNARRGLLLSCELEQPL
jgi:hypothetical protein